MSPALRDLQAAFADHVTGDERPDLVAAVVGDSIPAAARLRVYRHHISRSLGAALAATFSTVEAIVGEAFFRAMAQAFVAGSLPRQPVLTEYGEAFPAFIAGYSPASDLPYLGDVARLDWALNVAFHASAEGCLAADDLAAVPAERLPSLRLTLAPGTALVRSHYPLDRIWSASQPGAPGDRVDLDAGGVALLVLRRSDDAAFVRLGAGEAAFLAALADGGTLEAAALAAGETDPAFDLMAAFARVMALGVFAAVQ